MERETAVGAAADANGLRDGGTARHELSELDAVGVRHGTHLSSLGRDCLAAWEPLLARLRDEPFDLLEIGVGSGASLRTWREWFPAARLAGFDARRVVPEPPIAGCEIAHGGQSDLAAFHDLLRRHRFRLIVDDGSRHPSDRVATFLTLFPWMPPCSLYVCATLDDEPGDRAGEDCGDGGAEWFAALGAALTATRVRDRMVSRTPALASLLRHVRGVSLFRGSAVVAR